MSKAGLSSSNSSDLSESSSSSEEDQDDILNLKNFVSTAVPRSEKRNTHNEQQANNSAASAIKRFKEELLKPVTVAPGALVSVDTAEESAETMLKIVSTKIPKPTKDESKKLRKLKYVDHSTVSYIPIRKDFYVTPPDIKQLSADEIKQLLKELDGAKISGNDPPRPMRTWHGTGLPDKVFSTLERKGFHNPLAVQSIVCPVLMRGRDVLVTAKTGSGKTLSYALPLIRHCVDQPKCNKNEGPIGLVLVPTQELAVQVFALLNELCEAADLRCVASYGSSSLADNIKQAKLGCEVMVCTPGRLLDLLTVNGGRTVSLSRSSFVVIDEADRLFDSGFMEHVEAFLKNIRPDRQLAMISATLPKELRKILLSHLSDPIEVSVGGKPSPSTNVEQTFYLFNEEIYSLEEDRQTEDEKFKKLLEILGEEGDGSKLILIFTQRKEEVDELLAKLSALGYQNRIATLYSGMDPIDREFALEHFSPGKQFILIATSLAERGLDLPFLELVINYQLPNHYEAYIHRVGRTGRAGKTGRAISFFTRTRDDDIAPELVEGLQRAGQLVPDELAEIAARVSELRKQGLANGSLNFYRGYKKSKKMKLGNRDHKDKLRQAAKASGLESILSLSSSGSDSDLDSPSEVDQEITPMTPDGEGKAALTSLVLAKQGSLTLSNNDSDKVQKALEYAQKTTSVATGTTENSNVRFSSEYPVNDLPSIVRSKLQSGAFLRSVADETKTSIIKKGVYFDPKRKHSHRLKEGERPLYLLIVGANPESVQSARQKLNETKDSLLERVMKKGSAVGAVI